MTEDKTSIGVSKENRNKLSDIKYKKELKDFDAVISHLLDNQKKGT